MTRPADRSSAPVDLTRVRGGINPEPKDHGLEISPEPKLPGINPEPKFHWGRVRFF